MADWNERSISNPSLFERRKGRKGFKNGLRPFSRSGSSGCGNFNEVPGTELNNALHLGGVGGPAPDAGAQELSPLRKALRGLNALSGRIQPFFKTPNKSVMTPCCRGDARAPVSAILKSCSELLRCVFGLRKKAQLYTNQCFHRSAPSWGRFHMEHQASVLVELAHHTRFIHYV